MSEPSSDLRSDFWLTLSYANKARNEQIDPQSTLDHNFFFIEMVGELGEWANKLKKLERESLRIPGSTTTREEMLLELGDFIICLSLFCNAYGISPSEINKAVVDAFNNVSARRNLDIRLPLR